MRSYYNLLLWITIASELSDVCAVFCAVTFQILNGRQSQAFVSLVLASDSGTGLLSVPQTWRGARHSGAGRTRMLTSESDVATVIATNVSTKL
ncbi:hypothetical protein C8R47DRAFT_437932 [Mycena vitilis]|nr:hypothetical protein C8R47DRAFT_437932 [Mycena vitilis]